MIHNHLLQCSGTALLLIWGFYFYMKWRNKNPSEPDRLIDMSEGTPESKGIVPSDIAEEYQTLWNVPEWKRGGYEKESRRIWEKIDKNICAEEN